MIQDDLEAQLTATIHFALGQYACKPPRTRDISVTDAYYHAVAAAIVRQIKLSGWDLTASKALDKRPARLPHSTAMFVAGEAQAPGQSHDHPPVSSVENEE